MTNAETLFPSLPSSAPPYLSCSLFCKYSRTITHTRTDSIEAAIHVSDTSLSGGCNAHKDLFISSLNARCHIRGSGGLRRSGREREREKRRIYVTHEVTTFQRLSVDGVEVSRGQEGFFASAGACFAVEELEPNRKTDS